MADLDLGTEAIDTQQVTVPTSETIIGFYPQLTLDQKWCQFHIYTSLRERLVNPGEDGQEDFAEMCKRVKAMFQTPEGAAVIAAMKAALRKKPLVLKTSIEEVAGV